MLSIDCGVNAIGVAIWNKKPTRENVIPDEAFCIHVAADKAWEEKCIELVIKLDKLANDISSFRYVVTEFPEVYGGAKGNAAAKNGDVAHMAHFCGALHAYAYPRTFIPVLPTEWKKQLKKEIMERRLRRAIGDADGTGKAITEHAWDAVGIGLYFAGIKINDKELFSSQLDGLK
jgi:hypothetical protein